MADGGWNEPQADSSARHLRLADSDLRSSRHAGSSAAQFMILAGESQTSRRAG